VLIPDSLVVRANALMRPTLELVGDLPSWPLPVDLAAIRDAGVRTACGQVHLAASTHQVPEGVDDDWAAERWVNDVHLAATLSASDERWRPQVLAWASQLAFALLPQAADLLPAGQRVQVDISLQSAAGQADPELDHPTATLHLYRLRTDADDLSTSLDDFTQPVLTITTPHDAR
jgi:hypothetical protein